MLIPMVFQVATARAEEMVFDLGIGSLNGKTFCFLTHHVHLGLGSSFIRTLDLETWCNFACRSLCWRNEEKKGWNGSPWAPKFLLRNINKRFFWAWRDTGHHIIQAEVSVDKSLGSHGASYANISMCIWGERGSCRFQKTLQRTRTQQRCPFLILQMRKLRPQEGTCPRPDGLSQDLKIDFLKTVLSPILFGSFGDNLPLDFRPDLKFEVLFKT